MPRDLIVHSVNNTDFSSRSAISVGSQGASSVSQFSEKRCGKKAVTATCDDTFKTVTFTMLDAQDVQLQGDTRVSPSPCETPVPSYENEKNFKKKNHLISHLPSHLPRLHMSKRLPGFSNNFAALSRIPSQSNMTSGKEIDRSIQYLNVRPIWFTHYVIQHLDSLVQVIIQPVDGGFKVTDNTHRLLYTVRADSEGICCGMEGPEVVFKAVNSQKEHVLTFVKHSSNPCLNRLKYVYVKLHPDVPLGTIDQESEFKALVKNCSGDVLCTIRLEDPRAPRGSLVLQVIPSRKFLEWGRMEECGGSLIATFPKESDAVTKAILIASGVLTDYTYTRMRIFQLTPHHCLKTDRPCHHWRR